MAGNSQFFAELGRNIGQAVADGIKSGLASQGGGQAGPVGGGGQGSGFGAAAAVFGAAAIFGSRSGPRGWDSGNINYDKIETSRWGQGALASSGDERNATWSNPGLGPPSFGTRFAAGSFLARAQAAGYPHTFSDATGMSGLAYAAGGLFGRAQAARASLTAGGVAAAAGATVAMGDFAQRSLDDQVARGSGAFQGSSGQQLESSLKAIPGFGDLVSAGQSLRRRLGSWVMGGGYKGGLFGGDAMSIDEEITSERQANTAAMSANADKANRGRQALFNTLRASEMDTRSASGFAAGVTANENGGYRRGAPRGDDAMLKATQDVTMVKATQDVTLRVK